MAARSFECEEAGSAFILASTGRVDNSFKILKGFKVRPEIKQPITRWLTRRINSIIPGSPEVTKG